MGPENTTPKPEDATNKRRFPRVFRTLGFFKKKSNKPVSEESLQTIRGDISLDDATRERLRARTLDQVGLTSEGQPKTESDQAPESLMEGENDKKAASHKDINENLDNVTPIGAADSADLHIVKSMRAELGNQDAQTDDRIRRNIQARLKAKQSTQPLPPDLEEVRAAYAEKPELTPTDERTDEIIRQHVDAEIATDQARSQFQVVEDAGDQSPEPNTDVPKE
jgi:hypothetical protein